MYWFFNALGFRSCWRGLGKGPLPAVCFRMSLVPAHTTVKTSQNHADPPCCRRQVRSLVDPRAGGLRDEDPRRTQDVLERGRTHAARRRPTSADSSGRGDHLPESLGDRELAAPSVLGHGRYWGRRPDAEGRERFSLGPGPEPASAGATTPASLSVDLRRGGH